ncbi:TetR/AcrR family transcriptional regulator [Rhodococcus sp. NPDC057529]|uniref:TetR/AcrR family transcriptional regulator n=1 Tax=Rhodococcus sp. NPDC057529 TaxID=3346158 RepID=UPI00366F3505
MDPETAPDRRTSHRQRRRDKVYDAAIELFIEQGFDNTTMDQIAERADIARATVFNYFERKTALLDEWMARRRQRATSAVNNEKTEDSSLEEVLRLYITEIGKINGARRDETVALMTACLGNINMLAYPALGDELAIMIENSQPAQGPLDHADAGRAGILAAIASRIVLSRWIAEEPEPFDLETELLAMLDVILHGVLGPLPKDNRHGTCITKALHPDAIGTRGGAHRPRKSRSPSGIRNN